MRAARPGATQGSGAPGIRVRDRSRQDYGAARRAVARRAHALRRASCARSRGRSDFDLGHAADPCGWAWLLAHPAARWAAVHELIAIGQPRTSVDVADRQYWPKA